MPSKREVDSRAFSNRRLADRLARKWIKKRITNGDANSLFFKSTSRRLGTDRSQQAAEVWFPAMTEPLVRKVIEAAVCSITAGGLEPLMLEYPDEFGLLWNWSREHYWQFKQSDTAKALDALSVAAFRHRRGGDMASGKELEEQLVRLHGSRPKGWRKPIEEATKLVSRKSRAKNRD